MNKYVGVLRYSCLFIAFSHSQPSSSEKALANQFLAPGRTPTTTKERTPATKTVHLQTKARCTGRMRSELLGTVCSGADDLVLPVSGWPVVAFGCRWRLCLKRAPGWEGSRFSRVWAVNGGRRRSAGAGGLSFITGPLSFLFLSLPPRTPWLWMVSLIFGFL